MAGRRFRIFSRVFKEAAVRGVLAGEKIRAVASALRLRPQLRYTWRDQYEPGGTDSRHEWRVVPNLARGMQVTSVDQLSVADITSLQLRDEFAFLAS
jgi:transposase-like protein